MKIFETFGNAFKIKELRTRIFITLALLVVFRFGAHIPLPGVNQSAIEEFQRQAAGTLGGLWELLQIFSGGALSALALCSLGIMPYITASIIISLLTKINPTLEAIAKEGPSGYRKINQYTRLLTIPIAFMQAMMGVRAMWGREVTKGVQLIPADVGFGSILVMAIGLTAGAMFIMWLGEQITEHGIGNGASVLIMAGIVARLPSITMGLIENVRKGQTKADALVIIYVVYVFTIVAIVFVTQSQRRIPVQNAKQWRGQKVTLAQRSYIPLKVNQAGVMPVIFASSLLVIPSLLGFIPGLGGIRDIFWRGTFVFVVFYAAMIFFFSYFWTFLFFPPDEWAKNLKEYGSFIPGVRPGNNTAEYLDRILKRITLCGAAFLCAVALLPDLLASQMDIERRLVTFVGGTGLLIVVGVCQDLAQKIESYLLIHQYSGFMDGKGTMRARR